MILKINPADVVAIPSDYNNTKGRTWKYEVVGEYLEDWKVRAATEKDNGFNQPLYSSNGGEYGTKPSGQKFYNKRNAKGQFVKKAV